jgi:hypothetical protein
VFFIAAAEEVTVALDESIVAEAREQIGPRGEQVEHASVVGRAGRRRRGL